MEGIFNPKQLEIAPSQDSGIKHLLKQGSTKNYVCHCLAAANRKKPETRAKRIQAIS
jgi:hypothetical protein